MNLLLAVVDVLELKGLPAAVAVHDVVYDSRAVEPGDLFCCLPGTRFDGHRFAAAAVAAGAVGVICERFVPELATADVVQARVASGTARVAMARAAAARYGEPARQLTMAGVTGTNGKTSVTHLLGAALAAAGRPTTVLGTLSGHRTTPEAPDLQRQLAEIRDAATPQRAAVAMEVSSHALAQARVETIRFDVAVFTNLSHDHLDFHGDMERYFEAKASLFTPERAAVGVVNVDDPYGRRLVERSSIPCVEVGVPRQVTTRPRSTTFRWRDRPIRLALTGATNAVNAVLAAEAAVVLGVSPDAVVDGLATARPIPGRFEVVAGGDTEGPTVLVDYAHTPSALGAVVEEARRLSGGRVIVVFGCGGNRDTTKRPEMGSVAVAGADLVVLTSDNPRDEDPARIIEEVQRGMSAATPGQVIVIADRRAAIERALVAAADQDVVVVAGKGHERYQEIAGRRRAFDDRAVVADILARSERS
jgi:UDP-N-acetylmuramoyl-L-alanyl-D-glutamate--2,6-diaminopimelate ligase